MSISSMEGALLPLTATAAVDLSAPARPAPPSAAPLNPPPTPPLTRERPARPSPQRATRHAAAEHPFVLALALAVILPSPAVVDATAKRAAAHARGAVAVIMPALLHVRYLATFTKRNEITTEVEHAACRAPKSASPSWLALKHLPVEDTVASYETWTHRSTGWEGSPALGERLKKSSS